MTDWRSRLGRLRRGSAGAATADDVAKLRRRVRKLEEQLRDTEAALAERVAEVEEGLQEQRALSQRVAALGDLVAEVIGAAARGTTDEFEDALAKYAREI
ncbi:MAG TPA: DUF6752 domain-containing protein [Nocardioidaceae bacterium]